jgi:hypothetical protein
MLTGVVFKKSEEAGCWWLPLVIPATKEAEIRRIKVQSQPQKIVHKTVSRKNPRHKKKGWQNGSSDKAPVPWGGGGREGEGRENE